MLRFCFIPFKLVLILLFFSSCNTEKGNDFDISNRKQNFDCNWQFTLDNSLTVADVNKADARWRKVDLPHDWSIEGKTDPGNPMGNDGGYFPAGIGWYRKDFKVPAEWSGKKISVYFEGVYMNAEVFINGKSIGLHPYGYTSFEYDLSAYLEFGKSNTVAVRVDNSHQKNCRWYSGSGIYRHVWLRVTSPLYIKQWGTAIVTRDVTDENATISVNTTVCNEMDEPQTVTLRNVIKDANNQQVVEQESQIELQPNSEQNISQEISVNKPLLWDINNPYLYSVQTVIAQDSKIFDATDKSFGIRTIKFSAENGFLLNGKQIKINGGCVHHDNGCLGSKAYDRAEEKKVELLKSAGFNLVRTSHNPPSEAFLNACDRLGLLVIDESFDGWKVKKNDFDYSINFDKWWKRDIASMVLRDRNHPSIIMWSSGNEIIERKSPDAVKTANQLNSYIRSLDSTRPVTSAMASWNEGWEIFDPLMAEHDVCGYNYMMHESESDHKRVPSRIIIQTESYPKDAFYNWNMVQNHNYIIGDIVWTAMDYLGESSIGRYYYPGDPEGQHWEHDFYPWHGAYCGDIDITGWRKPISHYRNMLWNDTEKLYMAVQEPNPIKGAIKTTMWAVWPTWESWTWPGYEGKKLKVEVYSKYESVNLYLNGKLIQNQPTTIDQEFKAVFTVPYAQGELKAVGVQNGEEVEETTLQTAGEPAQIYLSADRKTLKANGQDLSYITVEVCDKDGVLAPNAVNELEFGIEGEGEIIAVANANMQDSSSYLGTTRKAWKGRAMVVVKSSHNSGDIKLIASSPGLQNAEIDLQSRN